MIQKTLLTNCSSDTHTRHVRIGRDFSKDSIRMCTPLRRDSPCREKRKRRFVFLVCLKVADCVACFPAEVFSCANLSDAPLSLYRFSRGRSRGNVVIVRANKNKSLEENAHRPVDQYNSRVVFSLIFIFAALRRWGKRRLRYDGFILLSYARVYHPCTVYMTIRETKKTVKQRGDETCCNIICVRSHRLERSSSVFLF